MSLDNIRIVLVRTFHPGNIGAAARSMKTMSLSDLVLVAPKNYPDPEAIKMAAGAQDLLDQASVYNSLEDALADCTVVVATTARPRGYDLPTLEPEDAATLLVEHARQEKVGLMFGPERMGLHNQDLHLAKYRVSIPANPDYSSLNLAAAVQTLSYEVFKQYQLASTNSESIKANNKEPLPLAADMQRFYQHLEKVMTQVSFLRPHQGETLLRVRTLFAKAELTQSELNILRGFLNSIERSLAGDTKD